MKGKSVFYIEQPLQPTECKIYFMVKLKKILKYFLLLILILLAFIIYNSVYFDIPKENVIAKHAKGASEFIELKDGSLIHVRDEGNKNGSTLVLIHGFNGSLFNFESMNKFLLDDFRIISLDLPAHGLTGPVNSDDYSIDGFIRVINEVLEIKNINEFFLAGHSMGGRVVWDYTIDYPEEVSGLLIIGSAFLASEEEYKEFQSENAPPIAFKLLEIPFFRQMLGYITPRFIVTQAAYQTVYNQNIITEELIDQFHEIILLEGSREAIGNLIVNNEKDFVTNPKLLQNIKVPTLILHGEEDNLVDVRFNRHFLENIPNISLILYPKVGHMPPMEIPEIIAEDIKNFIVN